MESPPEVLDGLRAKIEADRFWLAGTFVGVIVGAILPWEQVKIFSVVVGGIFAMLIFGEMLQSIRHEDNWHKAKESAYRKQNGLPMPAHEAKNLPLETPAPVHVETTTRTSPTSGTMTFKQYDNPPTARFLQFLFESMDTERNIPTETTAAAYGKDFNLWKGNQSNTWLTYTDAEGITEKIRAMKNGNSPRRLVDGMTLAEALRRFGMEGEE
jgi:hypothetical protein